MEYLEKKYETAKKSVKNLRKGIERFTSILPVRAKEEEEYLERPDSLIKRFELAFDTFWKYARVYLEVDAGLVQNSPKSVFRECLRINKISEGDTSLALTMVDTRNQTAHTYHEDLAEDISGHIPNFCTLMEHIMISLNPKDNFER